MTDFASADLTAGQFNAVVKKLGGYDATIRFLRDELVVSEKSNPNPQPNPEPEPPLDFNIYVERSIRPAYPDFVEREYINTPEFLALESSGPTDYNLETEVEQWLYGKQKRNGGWEYGNVIYSHLKDTCSLPSCLNLQDGLVIQAKGIAVFHKLFGGKAVFLWGSVVQRRRGPLLVPCLYEGGGEVVVRWYYLDDRWNSNDPALRFRK